MWKASRPAHPRPSQSPAPAAAPAPAPAHAPVAAQDFGIPHEAEKLSNIRKTIARRLTESKQTIPHIYLTVDIRLDALIKLRGELNHALTGQGVKLSVNDLLIKALAKALLAVPKCNVQFAGDTLLKFSRADISVAVSIPAGLITPIIVDAGSKSVSAISKEMKDLGSRAKDGKLAPHEYQGGTASLSNMGMMGIKQFEAVINPPAGDDHGDRRGRTAALCGRRRARHRHRHVRDRQLRPPRRGRRGRRGADEGLQGTGGGAAGSGGVKMTLVGRTVAAILLSPFIAGVSAGLLGAFSPYFS